MASIPPQENEILSGNVGEVLMGSRHKHNLCLEEGLVRYTCSGCRQDGANIGYKCRSCPEFVLHKDCAVLPDEFTHPFFKQRPFKFRPKTLCRHYCDGCGEKLQGFVFETSGKGLRLHPLCMALPTRLSYRGHNHTLNLVTEKGVKCICTECRKENLKWKYRCEMTSCNFKLDMNCAVVKFHGLSEYGITLLQRPSKLKKVGNVSRSVVSNTLRNFCEGFVEGTGEGVANVLFNEAFGDGEGEGDDNEGGGDGNEEEAGEEGGDGNEEEAGDNEEEAGT